MHVLGDVEHRLQHVLVAAGRNVGHELQQAAAAVDHTPGDLFDLLAGGVVTRDRRTAFRLVDGQPRRRETESADLDRLFGQRPHLGEVIGGGRLAVGAALPHHVDPQRGMREVGGHVDIAPAGLQRIQVFGERLPVPRQAVGHHDAGNVLDPGHHVDEHVVVFLAARREADPAVAHHDRGHPVRRRRSHPLRPDGLAVVVGVQVDEARGDQQTGRIDFPLGGVAV